MEKNTGRLRLNRSSHLVMQALGKNERLSSAQEIHLWLKQNEPDAPGLTTIYRALDSLLSLHMIQIVDLRDGERRYEPIEPGRHHHHLICEGCRANIHMDQCFVDNLTSAIKERHGFEVTSHILEIFGTCNECGRNKIS